MRWFALIAVLSLPALADLAPPPPEPTVAPVAPAPAKPVALEHPGGNDQAPAAPMGVIEGGWAYVYAAWGAGILGLIAYAASLFLRRSDATPPGAP